MMKNFRILIFIVCMGAALIALWWQARTISNLRREKAELRYDLKMALDHSLADPALPLAEREKMELIKLRHEVRALTENVVDAHTRERNANLRTVARLFLPGSGQSGPYKIRPEWKGMESSATNFYAQAMKALVNETNDYARFLKMERACTMSLAVGRTEDARQLAMDVLALDEKYSRGDPERRDGGVVHNGHMVLGRIAVDEGRIEEAKRHLLAAGETKGSPVLSSFGPNVSLAKDLLEKGEQQTVLTYLELCRKFWNSGKLDEWIKDIRAGRIPEFSGNLL